MEREAASNDPRRQPGLGLRGDRRAAPPRRSGENEKCELELEMRAIEL